MEQLSGSFLLCRRALIIKIFLLNLKILSMPQRSIALDNIIQRYIMSSGCWRSGLLLSVALSIQSILLCVLLCLVGPLSTLTIHRRLNLHNILVVNIVDVFFLLFIITTDAVLDPIFII